MGYDVRLVTAADDEQVWRMGAEGFGYPERPETFRTAQRPGYATYGLFDDDQLVAKAVDCEYDSWFGHEVVPTCGIAGVTTQLEARGAGLLTPLLRHVHHAARQRGAVVGTLYPTAAGIYRRFGYEIVGCSTQVELRTADLALLPEGDATTVRARGVADYEAVLDLYDQWAAEQNGPLTRSGPRFPADAATAAEWIEEDRMACTLALDTQDRPIGYALWKRTKGYHAEGVCEIDDLVAVDLDGWFALLRALGSNAAVAPVTRLWTSGLDVIRHLLPTNGWRVVDERPYMLSVLDVVRALEARGWSTALDAELDLRVLGDRVGDIDGSYRVGVTGGRAECTRLEERAHRTYTPRGLALAYAGAQSSANLRFMGHLAGPDDEDAVWDALLGGRQVHIRDYF